MFCLENKNEEATAGEGFPLALWTVLPGLRYLQRMPEKCDRSCASRGLRWIWRPPSRPRGQSTAVARALLVSLVDPKCPAPHCTTNDTPEPSCTCSSAEIVFLSLQLHAWIISTRSVYSQEFIQELAVHAIDTLPGQSRRRQSITEIVSSQKQQKKRTPIATKNS